MIHEEKQKQTKKAVLRGRRIKKVNHTQAGVHQEGIIGAESCRCDAHHDWESGKGGHQHSAERGNRRQEAGKTKQTKAQRDIKLEDSAGAADHNEQTNKWDTGEVER